MALSLALLRMFAAVSEEGHITRASERLGMQQPPLSRSIKQIETEVGASLLTRKARGVELTPAGHVFSAHASALLSLYDRMIDETRQAARGELGTLRIGVPPTGPFHPFVPKTIRAFQSDYPNVVLTMEELLRTELFQKLRDGEVDVCFVRAPVTTTADFVIIPLFVEPMIVALPAGHDLVKDGKKQHHVNLKNLQQETFIAYAREHGPALYEATIAACVRAGFSPRLGQDAPRITTALSLVAAGFGISLVPKSMAHMKMDGVTYAELSGPIQPKAYLRLAFRRTDGSQLVKNFVALTRSMISI